MALRTVPQILPGAALTVSTGRPYGSLSFPAAGGVQAIDETGAVINLAGSSASGTILPAADNTYDLGSTALRWRTGYFGTSVMTPLLTHLSVISGVPESVIQLSGTAVTTNFLKVTSGATGTAPIIAAVGSDTNVSLDFTPQGTGNIRLNGGATGGVSIGVNAASKVGFYATTPVARASAITPIGAFTDPPSAAEMAALRTSVNAIITALGAASGVGLTA